MLSDRYSERIAKRMKTMIEENNGFHITTGKRLNTRKRVIHAFTILEVVIAVAILALAFIAAMELAASSSRRTAKALEKWRRQHMLSQAAEYFLLTGPGHSIPNDIFQFDGYRAECVEAPPDIPEDVDPELGSWRLAKLNISVYDIQNKKVASISIHKILRDSHLNP